ncbi:MAG: hypothetical protein FWE91_03365 [Defluviitaleaceae bacterium]|nr:hypothetical protein [Defluviitaleaceae bacterium]MCL2835615.1 hypothetical protein [Defluviitaleaceae bacterium]
MESYAEKFYIQYELIWLIPSVAAGLAAVVVIVALIKYVSNVLKARAESINRRKFDELIAELREDNAHIKIELAVMRESLDSINKMMKEIG